MIRKLGACLCCLFLLLLECGPAVAATLFQQLPDTVSTGLTITNLANNIRTANGSTYDARQAGTGKGYFEAYVECVLTFGTAPTAGTAVSIWFLRSHDGTNFEDNATTRTPDLSCPVRNNTANRVGAVIRLRPLRYQLAALNDGTGQQINSGTISILPMTPQGN